ncbi:general secretion pathway protein B [Pseudoalteromonas citrea]|uniref:General secretion pathway protein B n=2 Tax=Pseudoalteromonas citrea TaxID=43655 RepID=A0AAD4FTB7_9GAMM|nr:general secretion pathway protein GspB [Pseudoalteromonas citrea]KAF7774428.1 general secretion pathway protein B [Pseudoalteromonas citrea]
MSYLFNALKQSEKTENSEQSHLAYQHQKQLNFYRRLSFGLGGIVLFGGAMATGFVAGKFVQTSTLHNSEQSTVVTEQHTPSTQPTATEQAESTESTITPIVASNPVQGVVNNTASVVNQPMTQGQQPTQYQWASVQIGVDVSGQAVYEQRLVPVNNQHLGSPVTVPSQQFTQPHFVQPTALQPNIVRSGVVLQPNVQPQLVQQGIMQQGLVQPNIATVNGSNQYQDTENTGNSAIKPYSDPELDNVSDELKEAFAQAVSDTEGNNNGEVIATSKDSAKATPIELLPAGLQNSIPRLRYQAHIYATEADKRWIKLNNRELYEGDNIGALQLLEITPEQALFNFDGYEFTLKAMQDWPL